MRLNPLKSLVVVGLSASVLLLGACGDSKDSASDPSTAAPSASTTPSASATPTAAKIKASDNFDAVTATGAFAKSPKVKVKSPWAIDKTRTKVLSPSDGQVVKAGQTVEVNYYGVDGRTGKKFDESFSTGKAVAFSLDQVVPGFSKGLTGQRKGSRVLIAMPGADGYDSSGGNAEAGINVGDTLIFVVDLVDVQLNAPAGDTVKPKAGLPTVTAAGDKVSIAVPKTDPPTKLVVQPLIKGKGSKVGASDTITFDYRWQQWSDGKLLEQSYGDKPASYQVSGLLPGMQQGLVGQTVGSRVLLVIPPALGYPDGNATPKIAKGETLVMVVDLLFTQAGQ
ncbi:FKBP-type peptidyl-prolyl cis-trans isomerase [uncultured Friedmanniella sp.]|uniref:FKBP-type peptidyl-prolyl cis-trans isomerase n=1 Tax=uncultured Friedmanniella sp. TaxID=335381 RepID=UPI0035C98093